VDSRKQVNRGLPLFYRLFSGTGRPPPFPRPAPEGGEVFEEREGLFFIRPEVLHSAAAPADPAFKSLVDSVL